MQKITKQLPATFAMSALGAAVLFASQGALAAGLTLNEQSASAMGTAYAGRSSSALDASTVFGNPAGMSRLDRMQVSGGLAFIDAHTNIKNGTTTYMGMDADTAFGAAGLTRANQGSTNKGDMLPFISIPFGYFVTHIDYAWHFGVGIYAPVVVKSKFEDTFAGRYQGRKTEVTMVTFQPTLSYKFNDMLSLGVGATVNYIDGTLSSNSLAPNPFAPGQLGDVLYTAKGDDTAFGANVGVLFQPYDNTTFGLTYRSHTRFKLSGDAKLEGHPLDSEQGSQIAEQMGLNPKYKGSAKLRFTAPESIDLSFTHKFDEQWTLYAGAVWTRWSRLDTINIDDNLRIPVTVPGQPIPNLTDLDPTEEVKYKYTCAYSIGGSYQVIPEWVLRAGFALDTSAASTENRSVRTPIAERKAITIGAGWNATPNLTIDAAYGYLWESTARVRQGDKDAFTNTDAPRSFFSGHFKNKIHGLSGQVTYRF